jgi:hypothetical protein
MHEPQAARVCGSVTSIPARTVRGDARPVAGPIDATGLHAAPARNSGPALVSGRPQRAWLAATQFQMQLRTARPGRRALCGPRADSIRPGPPGTAWALEELNADGRPA